MMPVVSKPYYWAVCDECGHRTPRVDHDVTAWDGWHQAIDSAREERWVALFNPDGQLHRIYCEECAERLIEQETEEIGDA